MNEDVERFRIVPRARSGVDGARVDHWTAIRDALDDLHTECSAIEAIGRPAFDAPHSLSYRAAEAVVIHFDDLLARLQSEHAARLPADLEPSAVRRTRNILAHNYRAANTAIVWDAVTSRIPDVIARLLET